MLRRLNRAEYANAIRDLLALDVDAAALLPPDDSAYGFDNIADVLGVSPSLQERYLSAAAKISALAVGDPGARAGQPRPTASARICRRTSTSTGCRSGRSAALRGAPLLPARRRVSCSRSASSRPTSATCAASSTRTRSRPTVDGERVHGATIGGNADLAPMFEHPQNAGDAIDARLAVARAGQGRAARRSACAFVRNLPVGDTRRLQPFLRSSADTLDWTGLPHIQSLTITGPFNATGPGDTPSRRRDLRLPPVRPNGRAGARASELACARRDHLRRSRAAPTASRSTDADLAAAAGVLPGRPARRQRSTPASSARCRRSWRARGSSSASSAIPPTSRPGSVYPLSDLELASRLSFFLWSSIPDDELLAAAAQGTLQHAGGARAAGPADAGRPDVRRRSSTNFAGQWLQLRNVRSVLPNSDEFPDFDDNLRQAFQRETELLFESIMREDRSVLDLLTADYTFVNERLARHYGIPNVYGSHFRRVAGDRRGAARAARARQHPDADVARRADLAGRARQVDSREPARHAAAAAAARRARRSKENEPGQKPQTMREQMAEHRANPDVRGCHKLMDPIGFALENFDAVGAWRTRRAGRADRRVRRACRTARSVDGVVDAARRARQRPGRLRRRR